MPWHTTDRNGDRIDSGRRSGENAAGGDGRIRRPNPDAEYDQRLAFPRWPDKTVAELPKLSLKKDDIKRAVESLGPE
jgi:hypothetical protein